MVGGAAPADPDRRRVLQGQPAGARERARAHPAAAPDRARAVLDGARRRAARGLDAPGRRRPDDAEPPGRGRRPRPLGGDARRSTPTCRCARPATWRSCSPPARPTGGCRGCGRCSRSLSPARPTRSRWLGGLTSWRRSSGVRAAGDDRPLRPARRERARTGRPVRHLRLARGGRHPPVLQHDGGDPVARAQPRSRARGAPTTAVARRLSGAVGGVRLARGAAGRPRPGSAARPAHTRARVACGCSAACRPRRQASGRGTVRVAAGRGNGARAAP